LDYVMAMFGAWRLGAAVVPLRVSHGDEPTAFLEDSSASAVIYTHEQRPAVDRGGSVHDVPRRPSSMSRGITGWGGEDSVNPCYLGFAS
jgi:hypothetical protein